MYVGSPIDEEGDTVPAKDGQQEAERRCRGA